MKEISLDVEDLRRLYKYVLTHCNETCPAERDPETCIVVVELGRILGMAPPCVEDYGGFDEETFRRIIKDIETRWGKRIEDVLVEIRERGYRSLQDQIDEMDGSFALGVLQAYGRRKRRKGAW